MSSDRNKKRTIRIVAAMTLGASALVGVVIGTPSLDAASGAIASAVVTVEPTRVLDTRFGTGLPGPVNANESSKLQITGSIAARVGGADTNATVVPAGATAVLLNVTALRPTADGFISIRPGSSAGEPSASNLNFATGDAIPNAVTVALPTSGSASGIIDIWYGTGTAGATTGVLVDIVGYTTAISDGGPGTPGPAGPAGADGDDPYERTLVVHDDTSFTSALSDASTLSPSADAGVLIYLEPGTYTNDRTIPSFIDLQGSGDGTILNGASLTLTGINDVSDLRLTEPGPATTDLTVQGTAKLTGLSMDARMRIVGQPGSSITLVDSDLDTSSGFGVSASAANELTIDSSTIDTESSGSAGSGTAVNTAATTLIRNSTLSSGNGVVTGGSGDVIEIRDSDLRSDDNTVVVSGNDYTVTIRDTYLENPDGIAVVNASQITLTVLNSTVAANGDAIVNSSGAGSPPEVCIGIAEIDLGDGSTSSWHDTTCS